MKKGLAIALFVICGTVYGQNNNYKQYLSENKEAINLTGKNNWNLLKQDAEHAQLIVLGESHGAQNTQFIDFNLLSYLNKTFGLKNYVAELDYAQSSLINEYLATGDEQKLKTVFRFLVKEHSQWGNYDFYNKVIKIRNLNKTLSNDEKIKYTGIDVVQDYNGYLKFIHHFIENKKGSLLDSLKIETALKPEDTVDIEKTTSFAVRYLQVIEQNKSEFQNVFKQQFGTLQYLIQNLSYGNRNSGINRPEGIYRNFKQLYEVLHWENQKLYGMWGFFHAHLIPFYYVGGDFISKLANSNHPIANKIVSIICLPIDSKYNVWDRTNNAWTKQKFSYDDKSLLEIEGIQDLKDLTEESSTTLFKLNGINSPFPKTGRLVNGIAPQGKLVGDFKNQDYANQYIILVRNSDWLHPLPQNF